MPIVRRTALSRLLVAGAALVLPSIACAQSQPASSSTWTLPVSPVSLPFLPTPAGLWTVTLGGNANAQPDFQGATRYLLSPVPIFSVQRAGSSERFIGPRDSPGIALFDIGSFRAGPVGTILSARKASSDSALNGLDDVKTTIEL